MCAAKSSKLEVIMYGRFADWHCWTTAQTSQTHLCTAANALESELWDVSNLSVF